MAKVKVDSKKCIGCGMCVSLAPKTFKLGKNMKSEVINQKGNTEATIQNAIKNCPVGAISSK